MTMYILGNPKTKKELKEWVQRGMHVKIISAGLGEPVQNGIEYISGPYYPAPHSFYAQVEVKDGRVVKVK